MLPPFIPRNYRERLSGPSFGTSAYALESWQEQQHFWPSLSRCELPYRSLPQLSLKPLDRTEGTLSRISLSCRIHKGSSSWCSYGCNEWIWSYPASQNRDFGYHFPLRGLGTRRILPIRRRPQGRHIMGPVTITIHSLEVLAQTGAVCLVRS
jgi:hypothetical protein